MKQRIWELDALRGLCLLGVMAVHLIFDLTSLYALVDWTPSALFVFIKQWGGVVFLLLSGICVTLGSKPVRRGLMVFAAGLLVNLVTWGMWHFGFSDRGILIYFGALHCLGTCMLLWALFRRLPRWALTALGVILAALGLYFDTLTVTNPWLFPLGLTTDAFLTSDYFPLLPHLGFFLLGAALGRTLYREKKTLFPKVNDLKAPVRGLCWVGRNSLPVYLLHQPVLNGLCMLLSLL